MCVCVCVCKKSLPYDSVLKVESTALARFAFARSHFSINGY